MPMPNDFILEYFFKTMTFVALFIQSQALVHTIVIGCIAYFWRNELYRGYRKIRNFVVDMFASKQNINTSDDSYEDKK